MAIMQGPPVQEAPEEGNIFPGDEEQAEKFLLNIIKFIHKEAKIPEVLAQAIQEGAPLGVIIGGVAAKMLTLMFTKIFKDTGGAQVLPEFAVEAVRRAVTEIAKIAEAEGATVPPKELQQAAKIAGDSLEQTMDQLFANPEGIVEGEPEPGMLQGPPQGPPVPQGGM